MEIAVDKPIELEKHQVHILSFSIGGTIALNFGLTSENINSLDCISSKRLRNETELPEGNLELYFGENDEYKPTVE